MLIDDILAKVPPRSEEAEPFLRDLRASTVMKIHNVADYIFETPPTKWDLTEDFANIAPPYEKIWMEWSQRCGWGFEHHDACACRNGRIRMGIALHSVDLNSQPQETIEWYKEKFPGSKWVCYGFFIWEISDTSFSCPPALCWGVSPEGRPIIPQFLARCHPLVPFRQLDPQRDVEHANEVSWFLSVPFMALLFLHFKNVRIAASPAPSPRLQKARQDKGKPPLLRWHTLTVSPVRNAVASANGGSSSLTPRALHRIRGHYKTYTDENRLFGKYTGMYWWDAHARGSRQAGIVLKDYRVMPVAVGQGKPS